MIFFLLVNKKMSTKNTKIRPSVYFMLDGMWDITQKQGHIDCFYRIVQFPPPHQTQSLPNPIIFSKLAQLVRLFYSSSSVVFASTET